MPVTLKDGHGTGNLAMVDSEGHLAVGAIQKSALQHQSETYENVYAFSNATYNYTAADTILLVKNTHASKAMTIAKIWVSGDTLTEVIVHMPAAEVTPTGTAVTGANLTNPTGRAAPATAIGDETNNTRGTFLWSQRIPANTPYCVDAMSGIQVGPGKSIGVDFVAVGAAANVTIWAYWKDLS